MVITWPIDAVPEQSGGILRDLLAEARRGNVAAFEQIILLHDRMVLRTARGLLGNPQDAQDAAQEVFLRLHRSLAQFDEEREFIPWLYRMTVNICHDFLRKRKWHEPVELVEQISDDAASPETVAMRLQEKALLERALQRLPEKERAAIVLRDLEGLPTAEVAEVLGSVEATVRSQISSGRLKLREYLGRLSGK